ncbi:MAG: hypothetical protein U9Q62_00755 [Campylobacterota bacterium]|nr:hypothetical protein [Campylobacterota bacterium]
MKRWLVHTLLLFALFGHLGHSFHDHHHDEAAQSCQVCVVDDLSKITTDHYTQPAFTHFSDTLEPLQSQCATQQSTPLYHSRAPPSSI